MVNSNLPLSQPAILKKLVEEYPLSPLAAGYQRSIQQLLSEWEAPEVVRQAALFLPWIEKVPSANSGLRTALPSSIWALLETWYELYQLTIIPPAGTRYSGDSRSLKLRRLMRQAYINLPLVILTVADHAVRMDLQFPESEDESFWRDTEVIFLPLLHMLGLWALRREWLEKTAGQLYKDDFDALEKRLVRIRLQQNHCVQQIQAKLDLWTDHKDQITCELRQPMPGRIIYRSQQGEPLEELCDLTTINVFVPTQSDCYRVLEFIHQLGTPVQGRFADYIAYPNANSYKALHTTIIGNKDIPICSHKLLAFRIATMEMYYINMWGIIKARFQDRQRYQQLAAWWQPQDSEKKSLQLLRDYDIGVPVEAEETRIYVFTPQGEVKHLAKGSTALDFAYNLHTQIGHQCRSVQVNGQKVPHATELHNGDSVFLKHDPFFQGPDPAWLHIAQNSDTRNKIKQGLRAMRQAIHPGRQHIARYLDALRKDSEFVVPEPQMEKYFMLIAEDLGLPDINSLFQAIMPTSQNEKGYLAPEKIIAFILEAELTTAVVDDQGLPIVSLKKQRPSFTNPVLRFCPNCKPAPGSPLILHRRGGRNPERLTLHRKSLPEPLEDEAAVKKSPLFGIPSPYRIMCLKQIDPLELDENVQWGEINLGRHAANITVVARDRSNLIGDLLQPFYNDVRVTITHIQATGDPEGMADILFTVESDTTGQVNSIINTLEKVADVIEVSAWPVTLLQSTHYKTRYSERVEIPYTPGPVREQRMLYGREKEIWQIRTWLEALNPERLTIICGQRRSGKTSLATLTRKFLRGPIRPIYIDLLQTRRDLSAPKVYWTIMDEIYRAVKKTISPEVPETDFKPLSIEILMKNPGREFFAYMHRIQALMYPQRLLLILDEFNIIVAECSDTAVFSELRALTIDDFPGITLMLITHTDQYYNLPPGHPAQAIYQQGVRLDLNVLDQLSAKKLIQEPLRGVLQYSENVVNEIVNSTGCHPYLINLLCRDVVEHVLRTGRTYVVAEDLQAAVKSLLRNGRNNFHFAIEKIDENARPLVVQLAVRQCEGERWVDLAEAAQLTGMSNDLALKTALYLGHHGILSLRNTEKPESYQGRIAMEYFCQWILRNWV